MADTLVEEGEVQTAAGGLPARIRVAWLPTLTFILLLILWEVVVIAFRIPQVILPRPTEVVDQMARFPGLIAQATAVTLWETLAGFIVAVAVGVPLAILITYSPLLRGTIYPLLVVAQSIPKVSIAPLILIWLGYGTLPKIIVAFLVSFFPIVIATAAGLEAVEPDLLDLARSLRASAWQSFFLIRFPTALPFIFSGLKVAITLAIIGAVIGEFVGANSGLGYVLVSSTANFNVPLGYACLVVLSVLGILLLAAMEGLERLVVPWARPHRAE